MDQANPFETRTTYRLHRLEYLVLFAAALALFVYHIGQVRWLPAVLLFVYIDLIGYIPGAIAFHRSPTKRISKVYYVLYNTMHSLVTQTVVITAWILLNHGWDWSLLVIPIHLFGDRGLFGNFLKPFNLSFEPVPHPAYQQLRAALHDRAGTEADTGAAPRVADGAPATAR